VIRLLLYTMLAVILPSIVAQRFSLSPPVQAASLNLTTSALPLNKADASQNHVGELVYRGGLVMASDNPDFGGISGLRIRAADNVALAISDAGAWISFRLIERNEKLIGAAGIGIAAILDQNGKSGTKANRDAEALEISTTTSGTTTSVAFEGDHRIWVYTEIDPAKPETFTASASQEWQKPWMIVWPRNGGAEAMCQLGSNKMQLLITEDASSQSGNKDAFITTKESDIRFEFQPEPSFKPTDCVSLPQQMQALVLQRHFSPFAGVAARLMLADFENIQSGARIKGREIARLAPPLSVDNMEAIAYVERQGRRFIYIASDDNFSHLQRTLLMKFEWVIKR
jgi:hypothetical protein